MDDPSPPLTSPDAERRRHHDWTSAFAARLEALGASEPSTELIAIGASLYAHYDLLEADDVARAVWKRWPAARRLAAG